MRTIFISALLGAMCLSAVARADPCRGPIVFPIYPGYVYSYSYPYPYPSSPWQGDSWSGYPTGRTIHLGEDADGYWKTHGGFAPADDPRRTLTVIEIAKSEPDRSPLKPGDAVSRIRDLGLKIVSIEATHDTAIYRLSDGRIVTAHEGRILAIVPAVLK